MRFEVGWDDGIVFDYPAAGECRGVAFTITFTSPNRPQKRDASNENRGVVNVVNVVKGIWARLGRRITDAPLAAWVGCSLNGAV